MRSFFNAGLRSVVISNDTNDVSTNANQLMSTQHVSRVLHLDWLCHLYLYILTNINVYIWIRKWWTRKSIEYSIDTNICRYICVCVWFVSYFEKQKNEADAVLMMFRKKKKKKKTRRGKNDWSVVMLSIDNARHTNY